jgi:hypothetical protein
MSDKNGWKEKKVCGSQFTWGWMFLSIVLFIFELHLCFRKTSPLILFVRFFKLAKIFPKWVFKLKNCLIKKPFLFLLLKITPEGWTNTHNNNNNNNNNKHQIWNKKILHCTPLRKGYSRKVLRTKPQ